MLGYFGLYSSPEAKSLENAVEKAPRFGLLPHQIGKLNAAPARKWSSFFKFLQTRPAA